MKKFGLSVAIAFGVLLFSGCSSSHNLTLNNNYTQKENAKIQVGYVSNQTAKQYDINIEDALKNALNQKLAQDNILWNNESNPKLLLNVRILKYSKGNAFARWVLPGAGATVLSVEGDLKDGDTIIGTAKANRTIAAGGAFTIGAWQTIFNDIASDLVTDIKKIK